MEIQFMDTGEVVIVKSAKDLVSIMRRKSEHFVNAKSNKDYMIGYSRRSVMLSNEDIRATSEDEFFEDLVKYKHIKVLSSMSLN